MHLIKSNGRIYSQTSIISARAKSLPEEYVKCFLSPLDNGLIIPGKASQVGDMEIQIANDIIYIKIGDHTEMQTYIVEDAIGYIRAILTDKVVFYFHNEHVEYFDFDEFVSLDEIDWNYFVWSGPFRYAFLDKKS